jgi:hypothetical protein
MIIDVFGWIIQFRVYKRIHPKPNKGLSAGISEKGIKIRQIGNYFHVVDKNGDNIPIQTKLVLEDEVNEACTVTVTFLCGGFYEPNEV